MKRGKVYKVRKKILFDLEKYTCLHSINLTLQSQEEDSLVVAFITNRIKNNKYASQKIMLNDMAEINSGENNLQIPLYNFIPLSSEDKFALQKNNFLVLMSTSEIAVKKLKIS